MNALVPASARHIAQKTITQHSKSFSLASKLLPPAVRDDARVVYAWCRRADDAVDLAPGPEQPRRLSALVAELDEVYAGRPMADAVLAAFQHVVQERCVPRAYPSELLAGMEMDVSGARYETLADLHRYCFRVAGTVGLMMCHVMGVRRDEALLHATHLGMAMQITNICRDVLEDWDRGRLYLPSEMLELAGAPDLRRHLGGPFPGGAREAVGRVMDTLLGHAELYYRSGDAGLRHLSPRCAFGVRAARLIYSRIGDEIHARGTDPLAGRAVVSKGRKVALVLRAAVETLARSPGWLFAPRLHIPDGELHFADEGVTL